MPGYRAGEIQRRSMRVRGGDDVVPVEDVFAERHVPAARRHVGVRESVAGVDGGGSLAGGVVGGEDGGGVLDGGVLVGGVLGGDVVGAGVVGTGVGDCAAPNTL